MDLSGANEVLSAVLASIHNLRFYQRLMQGAREAVLAGGFAEYRRSFLDEYARGR